MSADGHDEKRPARATSDVPVPNVSIDAHARKPVIFAVDAGVTSFGRIEYGLRRRYGAEYQVICETSAMWGMKKLRDLRAAREEVALILADQWMSDITGDEFLARIGKSSARFPVVVLYDGQVLEDPSNAELADAFGVNRELDRRRFDLAIVDGGITRRFWSGSWPVYRQCCGRAGSRGARFT